MIPRIVTAPGGGFYVVHRGALYWARTRILAVALADALAHPE